MPTWNEINAEILLHPGEDKADAVRKKYISELSKYTGRATIAYYSGWLQKKLPDGRIHPECAITDLDTNGFMSAIHGLPKDCGLDILLHTPGGEIEATRGIVEYLFKIFGRDIRVIVPQISMSAGTMIACAAKEIVLAKHSCLGPTDPQVNGLAAIGVLQEIDRAIEEIKSDNLRNLFWQHVFAKFPPGFIGNCERARDVTKGFVQRWLADGMLSDEANPDQSAAQVMNNLLDLVNTTSHSHHFMIDDCKRFGLKVRELESDGELQDKVLSVHHAFMSTFLLTRSIKVIQNSNGGIWTVADV